MIRPFSYTPERQGSDAGFSFVPAFLSNSPSSVGSYPGATLAGTLTEFTVEDFYFMGWPKGQCRSDATKLKISQAHLGERNSNWKGSAVKYKGLHMWVNRAYGRPSACENCGSTQNVQWANKTGRYLRERDDWLRLCQFCHRRHDGHADKMRLLFRSRYRRPFTVIDSSGTPLVSYWNIVDAALDFGVTRNSVSACLHGRAKTFKDRRFRAFFINAEEVRPHAK